MIYLDYTADTPVDPEVLAYFVEVENTYGGNPNSEHRYGKKARTYLENSTSALAELLEVNPGEIIYTSGATEANNLAVVGYCQRMRHFGRHIITNALEHPSVSAPLSYLQDQGFEVDVVRINEKGQIDLDHLRSLIREDTILITACGVDSELGTIQPVAEICACARAYENCAVLCDMTQAIGKIPVDLSLADMYSCAAHKFYGLKGTGLLIKKEKISLEPLFHGGASTSIFRSGTPATALNCALGKAMELALRDEEEHYQQVKCYNDELRAFFKSFAQVRINSPAEAIPHILNISVKGISGRKMQELLNEKGVCVSVKTACSVDALPSRAVMAISNDRKRALESFRISLSHLSSETELKEFEEIFSDILQEQ